MNLKPELQPTVECLAIERFGEALTEREQAHLQKCARCEAERSLWQSFNDPSPSGDEGAAVQWVVSEVRRRTTSPGSSSKEHRGAWLSLIGWRSLAGLAVIVFAIGIGFVIRDPEPGITIPTSGAQTYRTGAITVTSPSGDIARPPSELIWVAVEGAVKYDVRVLEVDQTQLWHASVGTGATRLELPSAVVARIVPGKTLLWTVTAFDGTGRTIGESGAESFRVRVSPR